MNEKKIIFISGCARSGTSATTFFLNQSSLFAIGLERYQNYFGAHSKLPDNAFDFSRFFTVEANDSWFGELPPYYEALKARWEKARYIGDKVPRYYSNIPWLFESYSNSKIIHCYRNIFDVANSFKKRAQDSSDIHWSSYRDVSMAVHQWNESNKKIVECVNSNINKDYANRIYILNYEKFITNSLDRRIFSKFIGIEQVSLPFIELKNGLPDAKNFLTPLEKDLIWSNVDQNLVREMTKIINSQFVGHSQAINKNRLIKNNGYHISEKETCDLDYGEFYVPSCSYTFRGRKNNININHPLGYISCIGSATTFGRFLNDPYPQKLESMTGIPFINLGQGGAKPETYLSNKPLLDFIKKSKAVLFEIMSGRGYPSPIFAPVEFVQNSGFFIDTFDLKRYRHLDTRLSWLLDKADRREAVFVDIIYRICFKYLDEEKRNLIRDSIVNKYVEDVKCLLNEVDKPIYGVMLTRNKEFEARKNRIPSTPNEWQGEYPHFIDEAVLNFLNQFGMQTVICRSNRGLPYSIKNIKTGMPANAFSWQEDPSINTYYPSQEMVDDLVGVIANDEIFKKLISET